MGDSFSGLRKKLDEFIRRYYANQIVRGLLITGTVAIVLFVIAVLVEYYGKFNVTGRAILVFGLLSVIVLVGVPYVLIPLLRLNRLGGAISYEQAAVIIGRHFKDVDDKLLNVIQLGEASVIDNAPGSDLLLASIGKRIDELRPVKFGAAVDFKSNFRFIKYGLAAILLVVSMYAVNREIIVGGTNRLVNYDVEFLPKAPFEFVVLNDVLQVLENKDFELQLKLTGEQLPEDVYVEFGSNVHRMVKQSEGSYTHSFKNVQSNVEFRFEAAGFNSKAYTLFSMPAPVVLGFDIQLMYPEYTRKSNETITNRGDLIVPEGTIGEWLVNTKNTKGMNVVFVDTIFSGSFVEENKFAVERILLKDEKYGIVVKDKNMKDGDSLFFKVKVVKDEYPTIQLSNERDSVVDGRRYFDGIIKDDYGFTKLVMVWKKLDGNGKIQNQGVIDIALQDEFKEQRFFHLFDPAAFGLVSGDKVDYYFQLWDNDGVNGAKFIKSSRYTYDVETEKELSLEQEELGKETKEQLQKGLKEVEQIRSEINELRENLLNKKDLDWQSQSRVEDLLDRQKRLEDMLRKLAEDNKKQNDKTQRLTELEKKELEKREAIEMLLEDLLDEELKELFKELEELLEEKNKSQVEQKLEEIQKHEENLENELDRSLELMKEWKVELKMEAIASELLELAARQDSLAGMENSDELLDKQNDLNEQFDSLARELKRVEEENNNLENPKNMDGLGEDAEEVEKDLENSSNKLQDGKDNKAKQSQKDASKGMKDMAQQIESSLEESEVDKASESMDMIRRLLENLVDLSFGQENIMEGLNGVRHDDPKFVDFGRRQRKLIDDSKVVEDSLIALAKRNEQVSNSVLKELGEVKDNTAKALDLIENRRTSQARVKQQYAITSMNNLALMLDESMQEMQSSSSSSSGSGSCSKPGSGGKGNGKPKPGGMESLKKMQEQLKKQLEGMKKQLDGAGMDGKDKGGKGKGGEWAKGNPGEGNQGKGEKNGQNGNSQELVKLAAQQAAIRKRLQDLAKKLNEDGTGRGNALKEIAKQMDEVEKDIVNKRIDRQTIKRQENILVRMLEHEKAQKEQEMDKNRKSSEGIDGEKKEPSGYREYKLKKNKEAEMLKTLPPSLKPYYKNKVNTYFNKVR